MPWLQFITVKLPSLWWVTFVSAASYCQWTI